MSADGLNPNIDPFIMARERQKEIVAECEAAGLDFEDVYTRGSDAYWDRVNPARRESPEAKLYEEFSSLEAMARALGMQSRQPETRPAPISPAKLIASSELSTEEIPPAHDLSLVD